jgi:hypothetical protein
MANVYTQQVVYMEQTVMLCIEPMEYNGKRNHRQYVYVSEEDLERRFSYEEPSGRIEYSEQTNTPSHINDISIAIRMLEAVIYFIEVPVTPSPDFPPYTIAKDMLSAFQEYQERYE